MFTQVGGPNTGSEQGQAHWVQVFLSGCSHRPAAAGHRALGPGCPAQHNIAAPVGRGSGEKCPGLRVRRPAPVKGRCTKCRGDQSPALKEPGNELRAPGQIHCMYLPVFPPSISCSGISQPFSENSTSALPAPPVTSLGRQPGAWRRGWAWGTRFTQPFLPLTPVHALSLWGWIRGSWPS